MRRLAILLLVAGCARATTPPVTVTAARDFALRPIRTLAVMAAEATPGSRRLPERALPSVTELLVAAASREPGWTVIDPERVAVALASAPSGDSPEARAGAAARKLGADATLTVRVSRYRERVGSDYGVKTPASVGLEILLVPAGSAASSWKAEYAFTQRPLSENLWNLWGVLRGGAKWLTAGEIARIGIDEAVDRLRRAETGKVG